MSGYHIPPNVGTETGAGQTRPSALVNPGGAREGGKEK
jgi:hypothetical protein